MERTPQEKRIERLAQHEDFLELLVEWDDIAKPWLHWVDQSDAAQANWMNGRASFVRDLIEDLRRYLPEVYERFERTRSKYVRTQLDRELRERGERTERDIRLGQYAARGGSDDTVE